ncbi:VOC family protein [Salimicrobium halophilum]|uniref:Catechol 2,3-dioxygenase n=1 Tax=Salimicrobium halophilum TaxID=86666 RepID=A0A1G8VCZ5_9BACI|nr:VOC family protein [Salimicrobium halophilum]SDJ63737.1 catechol 2,3-dioxygenase [Salimicrobium halophilum]
MEKKFFEAPSSFIRDIKLRVNDLDTSIAFYVDTLGFTVKRQSEKEAFLSAGDAGDILITLVESADNKQKIPRRTGLYHIAILLPDRSSIAKMLKHLVDCNVQLGAADHEVSEALYLNDPDGNGIEIYHDRDSVSWKWEGDQVNMTVDPLDAEGVMEEFDGDTWKQMPTGTVLGHIHLHVRNLEEARGFYELLGFHIVCTLGQQAYFMSTNAYHHHIGLNTWAGVGSEPQPSDRPGLEEYSISFPSEDVRNKIVETLKSNNEEVFIEKEGWCAVDPSGNKILLLA